MATNITNQSEYRYVQGEYRQVFTSEKGEEYVVIDGKRVNLSEPIWNSYSSNLTEAPKRLVNFYEKLLSENEEKKDSLNQMGKFIQKQLKSVSEKYDKILSSCGVKTYKDITDSEKQIEARKCCMDLASLNSEKINNSNRYYSSCMTSFDYALQKGNWQNQFNLAQHVMDSLG